MSSCSATAKNNKEDKPVEVDIEQGRGKVYAPNVLFRKDDPLTAPLARVDPFCPNLQWILSLTTLLLLWCIYRATLLFFNESCDAICVILITGIPIVVFLIALGIGSIGNEVCRETSTCVVGLMLVSYSLIINANSCNVEALTVVFVCVVGARLRMKATMILLVLNLVIFVIIRGLWLKSSILDIVGFCVCIFLTSIALLLFVYLSYSSWVERWKMEDTVKDKMLRVHHAKRKSEVVLGSILPRSVIDHITEMPVHQSLPGGGNVIDYSDDVAVIVSDIVHFTSYSSECKPEIVVRNLNAMYSRFDQLASSVGVQKVNTLGDGWLGVSGIPTGVPDYAHRVARLALLMIGSIYELNERLGTKFEIRIGIACGPCAGGVVGKQKFSYNIFSTTAHIADAIQSASVPMCVLCSDKTVQLLEDDFLFLDTNRITVDLGVLGYVEGSFLIEERGMVEEEEEEEEDLPLTMANSRKESHLNTPKNIATAAKYGTIAGEYTSARPPRSALLRLMMSCGAQHDTFLEMMEETEDENTKMTFHKSVSLADVPQTMTPDEKVRSFLQCGSLVNSADNLIESGASETDPAALYQSSYDDTDADDATKVSEEDSSLVRKKRLSSGPDIADGFHTSSARRKTLSGNSAIVTPSTSSPKVAWETMFISETGAPCGRNAYPRSPPSSSTTEPKGTRPRAISQGQVLGGKPLRRFTPRGLKREGTLVLVKRMQLPAASVISNAGSSHTSIGEKNRRHELENIMLSAEALHLEQFDRTSEAVRLVQSQLSRGYTFLSRGDKSAIRHQYCDICSGTSDPRRHLSTIQIKFSSKAAEDSYCESFLEQEYGPTGHFDILAYPIVPVVLSLLYLIAEMFITEFSFDAFVMWIVQAVLILAFVLSFLIAGSEGVLLKSVSTRIRLNVHSTSVFVIMMMLTLSSPFLLSQTDEHKVMVISLTIFYCVTSLISFSVFPFVQIMFFRVMSVCGIFIYLMAVIISIRGFDTSYLEDEIFIVLSCSILVIFVWLCRGNRMLIEYARHTQVRKYASECVLQHLQKESNRALTLMNNLFPPEIARRFNRVLEKQVSFRNKLPPTVCDHMESVGVLFFSLQNTSALFKEVKGKECIEFLNRLYCAFDELLPLHQSCIKIKNVGSVYIVMSSYTVLSLCRSYVLDMMCLAHKMMLCWEHLKEGLTSDVHASIGAHVGELVSGILGATIFTYDIFGDSVNVASRMQSTAEHETIQVSNVIEERLGKMFPFKTRGKIQVKGKGEMEVFQLVSKTATQIASLYEEL